MKSFRGETEACQNARPEILNQGIGRSNERLQGGAPFGRFEIQNNGDLILLTYPKRLKKGSELILYDGREVKKN